MWQLPAEMTAFSWELGLSYIAGAINTASVAFDALHAFANLACTLHVLDPEKSLHAAFLMYGAKAHAPWSA